MADDGGDRPRRRSASPPKAPEKAPRRRRGTVVKCQCCRSRASNQPTPCIRPDPARGCRGCLRLGVVCMVNGAPVPRYAIAPGERMQYLEPMSSLCGPCNTNSRPCDSKRPCDSCVSRNIECTGSVRGCFHRGVAGDEMYGYYLTHRYGPNGVTDLNRPAASWVMPDDYHLQYIQWAQQRGLQINGRPVGPFQRWNVQVPAPPGPFPPGAVAGLPIGAPVGLPPGAPAGLPPPVTGPPAGGSINLPVGYVPANIPMRPPPPRRPEPRGPRTAVERSLHVEYQDLFRIANDAMARGVPPELAGIDALLQRDFNNSVPVSQSQAAQDLRRFLARQAEIARRQEDARQEDAKKQEEARQEEAKRQEDAKKQADALKEENARRQDRRRNPRFAETPIDTSQIVGNVPDEALRNINPGTNDEYRRIGPHRNVVMTPLGRPPSPGPTRPLYHIPWNTQDEDIDFPIGLFRLPENHPNRVDRSVIRRHPFAPHPNQNGESQLSTITYLRLWDAGEMLFEPMNCMAEKLVTGFCGNPTQSAVSSTKLFPLLITLLKQRSPNGDLYSRGVPLYLPTS